MNSLELHHNLDHTLAGFRNAGFEAGSPSARCHGFMLGALTNAEIDFASYPTSEDDKLRLERELGIVRARVGVVGGKEHPMRPGELIDTICGTQDSPDFDAILVHGRAVFGDKSEDHIVAIVADGRRPYGVVDSLAPGGFVEGDIATIARYIEERFPDNSDKPGLDGHGRSWYLALTQSEKAKRSPSEEQWYKLGSRVMAYVAPDQER